MSRGEQLRAQSQKDISATLYFQHLSASLTGIEIWMLHKDSSGYLWMGTDQGLVRFDGLQIKRYPLPGNSAVLASALVHHIYGTGKGPFLLGTGTELLYYDPQSDSLKSFSHTAIQGLFRTGGQYVFPFYLDKKNNIWLYLGANGGVNTMDLQTGKLRFKTEHSDGYLFAPQPPFGNLNWVVSRMQMGIYLLYFNDDTLGRTKSFFNGRSKEEPATFIDQVYAESDTVLWLCADAGLIRLNPLTGKSRIFNTYRSRPVDANCLVPFGNLLLVGTAGEGLLVFDRATGTFVAGYRHHMGDPNSLSGNTILRCLLDAQGNLFLSVAGRGLDYCNLLQTSFQTHLSRGEAAEAGLSQNELQAVAAAGPGMALLATGDQLLYYDLPKRRIISGKSAGENIRALYPGGTGSTLVQTNNRLLRTDGPNLPLQPLRYETSIPSRNRAFIQDIKFLPGIGLVAATEQGLGFLDLKPTSAFLRFDTRLDSAVEWNHFQAIIPLDDRSFLLQAYNTNLYLVAIKNGGFRVIREVARTPFLIAGSAVVKDTAYIATSAGLLRYSLATQELDSLPTAIKSPCQGILKAEGSDFLWIPTSNGLFRYDARNGSAGRFAIADGLQGMSFLFRSSALLPGGLILLGSIDGLLSFRASEIRSTKSNARVAVHAIQVNDRPYSKAGNPTLVTHLKLSYRERNVYFAFNAIGMVAPESVPITYQLVGLDPAPVTVFGQGEARYSALPPGEYVFRLAADSDAHAIYLSVAPPWWQEWWAIGAAILLLAGIVLFIFLRRMAGIRRRETERLAIMVHSGAEERQRIARDLHDDLGARLSTLKLYIQAAARNPELLGKSAELVDEAVAGLRDILNNLIPRVLEENGLAAALEDLCRRVTRTRLVSCAADVKGFDIALKPKAAFALFRITQELVNNTLKHSKATDVHISLVAREGRLVLLYEDNGIGFDLTKANRGYGLTNIQTYVGLMQAQLDLDTRPGRGLTAIVEAPLAGLTA